MKLIIQDKDLKELPIPSIRDVTPTPLPVIHEKNKKPEYKEHDPLTKELTAIQAAINGDQSGLSEITGLSQSHISALSNGYDRPGIDTRKPDNDLRTSISQAKFNIADRATTKLMDALDLFEPTELKQKELPSAMAQLAGVVERMTGDMKEKEDGPRIQFVVVAPRMRSEETYEVIQVNE